MNPVTSESITADVFMQFEEDASVLAEPEFVSIPAPAPPSAVVRTLTVEQLKGQIAALTPEEHAELEQFLAHLLGLNKPADPAPASPPARAP